jgi:hypothetical protein
MILGEVQHIERKDFGVRAAYRKKRFWGTCSIKERFLGELAAYRKERFWGTCNIRV